MKGSFGCLSCLRDRNVLQATPTLRSSPECRSNVPDSAGINAMHPQGNPLPGLFIKVIE